MEFSIQILPPRPPSMKKNNCFPKKNLYVFIMIIITQFGEDFEDKIDIGFLKNVWNQKVEVKKSD